MGIQALLGLLTQHLGSYAQLGCAAATECRSAWARRLSLLVVAMATGMGGLVALWVAGLIAVQDTPWRMAYAAISALVMLGVATWAMREALAPRSSGPSADVLKAELQKDLELLQQWKRTI